MELFSNILYQEPILVISESRGINRDFGIFCHQGTNDL